MAVFGQSFPASLFARSIVLIVSFSKRTLAGQRACIGGSERFCVDYESSAPRRCHFYQGGGRRNGLNLSWNMPNSLGQAIKPHLSLSQRLLSRRISGLNALSASNASNVDSSTASSAPRKRATSSPSCRLLGRTNVKAAFHRQAVRQQNVLYYYFLDPQTRHFIHVRLQTWAPFDATGLRVNGHDWLAAPDGSFGHGLLVLKHNAFTQLDDPAKTQRA